MKPEALPPVASADGAPPSSLRQIDWCNFSYREAPPLVLRGCEARLEQRHSAEGGIWGFVSYRFASAVYGDLTGDGQDDALVVLEVTNRPVLLTNSPPLRSWQMELIQARGPALRVYTSESSQLEPLRVTIKDGAATLVLRDGANECEERWRFGAEGRTATRKRLACQPARPEALPGKP